VSGRHVRQLLIWGGAIIGAGLVAVAIVTLGLSGPGNTIAPLKAKGHCPGDRAFWYSNAAHDEIDSLIVSSSVASRIYVGKGNLSLYAGEGERRFRWRRLGRFPSGLEVSAGRRHDVLFASDGSVYASKDESRSWETIICGGALHTDVAVPAGDPRTIYLAIDINEFEDSEPPPIGGMYRSTDGGRSWTRFTRLYPAQIQEWNIDWILNTESVAVSPRSSKIVYLATLYGGIVMSRDGGANWYFNPIDRKAKVPISPGGPYLVPSTIASGAGAHPALWIVTNSRTVYRGDEYARHWTRLRNLRGIADVIPDRRLANAVLVVSDRGAVMRTVDGGRHWARIKGLPSKIQGVKVQPLDDAFYAWTTKTNVFRSRDHGATWTRLPPLPR
jgi:photosystem II stability/assembly factor-like uncharacterized protein